MFRLQKHPASKSAYEGWHKSDKGLLGRKGQLVNADILLVEFLHTASPPTAPTRIVVATSKTDGFLSRH